MLRLNNNRHHIIMPLNAMLLIAGLIAFLASCTQETQEAPKPKPRRSGTATVQKTEPQIDIHNAVAVIETAKGTIEVEFYADSAPETVKNFVKNVRLKFYNNEAFHRVEPGQLIQAGSAMVRETMPLEESSRQLIRGTVAMAGDGERSHASQFYICLDRLETDAQTTVFGEVVKGLEVLDKIKKDDKIVQITLREKG